MQPIRKQRSHLFTLRLWQERGARNEQVLRFKVQHVLSGEVSYFQDWSEVLAFVVSTAEKEQDDI